MVKEFRADAIILYSGEVIEKVKFQIIQNFIVYTKDKERGDNWLHVNIIDRIENVKRI